MILLTLLPSTMRLTTPQQTYEIDLSVQSLIRILSPNSKLPPTEMAWEQAIYVVEDAISYLRDELTGYAEMQVKGSAELRILAFAKDDNGEYVLAETLEKAFAVLAGYCSTRDLPDLPQTADFYAKVLLLREWLHHLDFNKIYIK